MFYGGDCFPAKRFIKTVLMIYLDRRLSYKLNKSHDEFGCSINYRVLILSYIKGTL